MKAAVALVTYKLLDIYCYVTKEKDICVYEKFINLYGLLKTITW